MSTNPTGNNSTPPSNAGTSANTPVREQLDARRREELEFFQTEKRFSEFTDFLVAHNQSKSNAHYRLTLGIRALGLVEKQIAAPYHYIITPKGIEALKSGDYEIPAGYVAPTGGQVSTAPSQKKVVAAIKEKAEKPEPIAAKPLITKPKPQEPVFIKVMSGNGIEVPSLNLGNFYWHKEPDEYIEQDSELKFIHAHLDDPDGLPLLFTGPKGVGKTQAFVRYCWDNNVPLIVLDCNENTDEGDLRGKFIIKGQETPFIIGKFPSAITVANHVGKCVLLMEEVNALTPQTQKIGNALLDARRNCDVPALSKTFNLDPDVRLLCAATMNYGYGGTFELNEDFKSRFIEVFMDYPDKRHEAKIIEANTELREELVDPLISIAVETRNAVEQGVVDYALSPRDLVLFGRALHTYQKHFADGHKALIYALKNVIVNRYQEKKNRDWISERIQSIFPGGVKIK